MDWKPVNLLAACYCKTSDMLFRFGTNNNNNDSSNDGRNGGRRLWRFQLLTESRTKPRVCLLLCHDWESLICHRKQPCQCHPMFCRVISPQVHLVSFASLVLCKKERERKKLFFMTSSAGYFWGTSAETCKHTLHVKMIARADLFPHQKAVNSQAQFFFISIIIFFFFLQWCLHDCWFFVVVFFPSVVLLAFHKILTGHSRTVPLFIQSYLFVI